MALPPQLMHTLENVKYQVKDAFWALSSCICQQSAKIKINGRTFKIVKVLGEGGFSFVYLAQDEHSGDSAVVQDPAGDGQIVYLFLPLYKRGNLQDAINANSINGTHFPEKEMARLFKGTCEAVRAMHDYRAAMGSRSEPFPSRSNQSASASSNREQPRANIKADNGHSDDEDDELFPHPEGDSEGGYSYHGPPSRSSSAPLVTKRRPQDEGETIYDGDEELAKIQQSGGENNASPGETELVPYAHRDLKPGNVMIADDGRPILMDFGSCMKARVKIENRSQALLQQDIAAEQSTMAYRAPELFDVKTGVVIDEKVDIWSLGCTLFALAYSHSPFENIQTTEQGGSIAMAVMNAQYKHPSSQYSQSLKDLIDAQLKVDPQQRPDIHQRLS
ncbi:hypothetical protein EW026_g4636 [Hermanssonia centrifuga]|uniref:non-specific serine/threonine protein kinase n=1 Tax=Hermanssonia centrifuga TaxID=98765 RepID=A0A4S4KGI2_9APHY|nr:hypothetical protein EW026_g4636 [Hermanssonia centrifuga]